MNDPPHATAALGRAHSGLASPDTGITFDTRLAAIDDTAEAYASINRDRTLTDGTGDIRQLLFPLLAGRDRTVSRRNRVTDALSLRRRATRQIIH